MIFNIVLTGKPQPKQRPRGGKNGFYSPKSDWEKSIKKQLRTIKNEQDLYFDCALSVDIEFTFMRPKNHFRSGKFSHLLKDSAPDLWHTQRPDRDNLDKAVLDVMTDVGIISDDCIVADGNISKFWTCSDENAGAIVTITKIK